MKGCIVDQFCTTGQGKEQHHLLHKPLSGQNSVNVFSLVKRNCAQSVSGKAYAQCLCKWECVRNYALISTACSKFRLQEGLKILPQSYLKTYMCVCVTIFSIVRNRNLYLQQSYSIKVRFKGRKIFLTIYLMNRQNIVIALTVMSGSNLGSGVSPFAPARQVELLRFWTLSKE